MRKAAFNRLGATNTVVSVAPVRESGNTETVLCTGYTTLLEWNDSRYINKRCNHYYMEM